MPILRFAIVLSRILWYNGSKRSAFLFMYFKGV